MPRIIHPPRSEHGSLRQPLTAGEMSVFALLDASLEPDWEIYLQPHLNGLRPDFVILNPKVGICVIE
ncbi:DNA helicase, partial [Staphylococcus pseudintermedius]